METIYEYGAQQAAEPFWQRIQKFFLLPFDKAVLTRIAGLSAALLDRVAGTARPVASSSLQPVNSSATGLMYSTIESPSV